MFPNIEGLMRLRQEELLQEAERYRLISLAQKNAPRGNQPYRRVLVWLGSKLSDWGSQMQARFGETRVSVSPDPGKCST